MVCVPIVAHVVECTLACVQMWTKCTQLRGLHLESGPCGLYYDVTFETEWVLCVLTLSSKLVVISKNDDDNNNCGT